MTDANPLTDLLAALLRGTEAKTIKWEQADHRGLAFIARRESGTATIYRSDPRPAVCTRSQGSERRDRVPKWVPDSSVPGSPRVVLQGS